MHPNPTFRKTATPEALNFARARGFGTLCLNGPGTPLLAHVPFLLNKDGSEAELHLLRSNPILRALDSAQPATLAVTGPDGYISPDWYGTPDQVPTWNYVAVHLTGTLHRMDQDHLRDLLDRLSAHFEAGLAPKPIWQSAKMTPEVLERMLRMIAPVRLEITATDSTYKLGQNKPEAVRLAAADALTDGTGSELAALAALMQAPPNPTA